MACSKFEYVKQFEQSSTLLKNTFLVLRVDGHSFHRFTQTHNFIKPNDQRCINLMAQAAKVVMSEFNEIKMAYGQSDEFSFILPRKCTLYQRRENKIITNVCSLFTSAFMMHWKDHFKDTELKYAPSFDCRAVCYPSEKNVRDYFSWRQADCHINNLYNTCFWALVKDATNPMTEQEAESILKDTISSQKNEMLFTKYGVNYNKISEVYRKGTVLYREKVLVSSISKNNGQEIDRMKNTITIGSCDIIGDEFWKMNGLWLTED